MGQVFCQGSSVAITAENEAELRKGAQLEKISADAEPKQLFVVCSECEDGPAERTAAWSEDSAGTPLKLASPMPDAAGEDLGSVEPAGEPAPEPLVASEQIALDSGTYGFVSFARQRVLSPHMHYRFHSCYRVEGEVPIVDGQFAQVFKAVALSSKAPHDRRKGSEPENPEELFDTEVLRSKAHFMLMKAALNGDLEWAVNEVRLAAEEKAAQKVKAERTVCGKCFLLGLMKAGQSPEKFARHTASLRTAFQREQAMLSTLEHPNIVKMYECFEEVSQLWLVVENFDMTVSDALNQKLAAGLRMGFEERHCSQLFRQVLHATRYVHAQRIVHQSIRLENIVLMDVPGQVQLAKLGDFTCASFLADDESRLNDRRTVGGGRATADKRVGTDLVGSLSYMAPEIYNRQGSTQSSDCWALGVVLYAMLTATSPYRATPDDPREDTVRRIQGGDLIRSRPSWLVVSSAGQELVQRFLQNEEYDRISASEASRHRWIDDRSQLADPASPRLLVSPRGTMEAKLEDFAPYGETVMRHIIRFGQLDALQKLILALCAQALPEVDIITSQQTVPWYQLYFALDTDEDGRLTLKEICAGLRALVPAGHWGDIETGVAAMDLNGTGFIDWGEWVALAMIPERSLSTQVEPMRTACRVMDRPSGDGVISAADLLGLLISGGLGGAAARKHALKLLTKWSPPLQPPPTGAQAAGTPTAGTPLARDISALLLESEPSSPTAGAIASGNSAVNGNRSGAKGGVRLAATPERGPPPALSFDRFKRVLASVQEQGLPELQAVPEILQSLAEEEMALVPAEGMASGEECSAVGKAEPPTLARIEKGSTDPGDNWMCCSASQGGTPVTNDAPTLGQIVDN
eukprot:TRINITY_DN23900_c0_g1_i1.p1 TRINITY_DN23900_c0_g1~~TRINITY_DN23900_c0_g1_i1.p1  ORF type:complete len:862 (-),score=181.11 TRINITY_DN23900_c0_g1_i1:132-2717(-)